MRNFDSPTKASMEADISSGDFRVFSSSDGFPYFVAPVFSTPAFSTPAFYSAPTPTRNYQQAAAWGSNAMFYLSVRLSVVKNWAI